jgi:hypothetical protein
MKISNAGLITAFLAVSMANGAAAASAYKFSPFNTQYTGMGSIVLTTSAGSISCTVSINGKTTNPRQISAVSFTGESGCDTLVARNLPWSYAPTYSGRAQLHHATLFSPTLGRCGPNELDTGVSNGTITLQDRLPGPGGICTVTGSITTTPAINIVPAGEQEAR